MGLVLLSQFTDNMLRLIKIRIRLKTFTSHTIFSFLMCQDSNVSPMKFQESLIHQRTTHSKNNPGVWQSYVGLVWFSLATPNLVQLKWTIGNTFSNSITFIINQVSIQLSFCPENSVMIRFMCQLKEIQSTFIQSGMEFI